MKTKRHHIPLVQNNFNSVFFALAAAGWDKIEDIIRKSAQHRAEQREASRKPALNLIKA